MSEDWPKPRDRRYKKLDWHANSDSAETEFGTYMLIVHRPRGESYWMMNLPGGSWYGPEANQAFHYLRHVRVIENQDSKRWAKAWCQLHYEHLQRQQESS